MDNKNIITLALLLIVAGALFFFLRGDRVELPNGESLPLSESDKGSFVPDSSREIFVTDGARHSILLDEILSGGPPKDGIPSIDSPVFVSAKDAEAFVTDESPGLGVLHKGVARFYPYLILVWHEIVNDTVAGDPLVVTYCPLCLTGVVYSGLIEGEPTEFGVSGLLWKSNLLMYNRGAGEGQESLWSQVLGEAVVGEHTGRKLKIIPSDAVLFGEWKKSHPDTEVLSVETGVARTYGRDPYGSYYTDETVSFGATFNDDRLHPKEYVLGIEIDGQFKAYHSKALEIGETTDTFVGNSIIITRDENNSIRMFLGEDKQSLPYIGGFWFSWLAVHPDTELLK